MIDLYERGGSLPTHHAVRLFVEGVEREMGFEIEKPADRRELIDALFDRLGNLLYRQQSLAWAAAGRAEARPAAGHLRPRLGPQPRRSPRSPAAPSPTARTWRR